MDYIINMIIISLFCAGLYRAAEPGMLLSRFHAWAETNIKPKWMYSPVIGCVYCMASIWGTIVYFSLELGVWGSDIDESTLIMWPITCCACVYLNGLFYFTLKKIEADIIE